MKNENKLKMKNEWENINKVIDKNNNKKIESTLIYFEDIENILINKLRLFYLKWWFYSKLLFNLGQINKQKNDKNI